MAPELTGIALGFSKSSLASVRQLNAYFLETLAQCARHPAWCGSSWEKALGPHVANVLPTVRQELSRSPVSLVCIGVGDHGSRSLLAEVDKAPILPLPAFLARAQAVQLAQLTLTLAWTLSRNDLVST